MVDQVSVLIPAYNEAMRIGETIAAVAACSGIKEIIVVDDGSIDQTAYVAQKAGAKTICLPQNRGKGYALQQGITACSGNILLFLDADLGKTAREAEKLLLPILKEEAEMTIAKFPITGQKSGFGLVKGLARLGIGRLGGIWLSEPLSGQRALKQERLKEIGSLTYGFGIEVACNIRAARSGWRIKEVETTMAHHKTGRDLAGFLHRGKQCRDILHTLWQIWRE